MLENVAIMTMLRLFLEKIKIKGVNDVSGNTILELK